MKTTEIRWDQQAPQLTSNDVPRPEQHLRPVNEQPSTNQFQTSNERSFSNSTSQRTNLAPVRFSNHKAEQSEFSTTTNDEKRWHRVSRFDTLSALSQKYYGSTDYALFIFEANRHRLVNPAILPIGLELIIPTRRNQVQTKPIRQSLPLTPKESTPPLTPIEMQHGWKRAQEEDLLSSF